MCYVTCTKLINSQFGAPQPDPNAILNQTTMTMLFITLSQTEHKRLANY